MGVTSHVVIIAFRHSYFNYFQLLMKVLAHIRMVHIGMFMSISNGVGISVLSSHL